MSTAGGKDTSISTYVWTAVISALIGFAAVYVTLRSPDNAGVSSPDAPASKAAVGGTTDASLAGFVRKSPPEAIADVTFLDAGGKELKLTSFKGRVVLLNLWATWCAPCRKEMPSLDRLQKELGSDAFEVVALAVDRTGLEAAGKFLADIKVTNLKLYADPTTRSGSALKAVGMPTTILIDKEGREVGRLSGPAEWDSEAAKALISGTLK